jgi:DNA-binding MarR family transcriptional regulator
MTLLLQNLGLSIKHLQQRHHIKANRRLASLGISLVQWDTLRHIQQNPDASMHALAQMTYQSDQAFGTLADRMTKKNLIMPRAGTGRAIHLGLTKQGLKFFTQGEEIMEQVLSETFNQLSSEQLSELGEILTILLNTQ